MFVLLQTSPKPCVSYRILKIPFTRAFQKFCAKNKFTVRLCYRFLDVYSCFPTFNYLLLSTRELLPSASSIHMHPILHALPALGISSMVDLCV